MSDPTLSEPPALARGLVRQSAATLVGKLLSGLALATTAIVAARELGPAGRGVLTLQLTIAVLLIPINDLGTDVAARSLLGRNDEGRRLLGGYLSLVPLLAVAEAITCATVGVVLLRLADIPLQVPQVAALAGYGATAIAAHLLVQPLFGLGNAPMASAADAAGSAAGLIATIWVALATKATPTTMLLAAALGMVLQIAAAVLVLRRRHPCRVRVDREAWRTLVRTGLPGVPLVLGQLATFRLDRYLLGVLADARAVGIYSVAATAPEALRMLPWSVSDVLLHPVARGDVSVRAARLVRRRVVALTVLAVIVGTLLAPVAVSVLFGDDYAGAVTPLRILLLAEIGMASFHVSTSVLTARGRIAAAGAVTLGGFVAVAVLDIALIPAAGVAGAAWASVASYWAMAVLAARRADARTRRRR